jgi:hypothetical protein
MKKENLSSPRTFQPTPESIKSKPNLPASKTFRSFPKGIGIAGAASVCRSADSWPVLTQEGPEEVSGSLTPGDGALLRFAAAAEILETDFWCSTTNSEAFQTVKSPVAAEIPLTPPPLAEPVSLDQFRTLRGSSATRSSEKKEGSGGRCG